MSLDADNIFKIQNAKHRGMEGYVLVKETSLGTDISSMFCRLCKWRVYAPYYRRDAPYRGDEDEDDDEEDDDEEDDDEEDDDEQSRPYGSQKSWAGSDDEEDDGEEDDDDPYYRRDEDEDEVNYLHIACAHLPTEMEHELHPGCTLRLCTDGGERACNLCSSRDGCDALYFECDCGEFIVDARCAFKFFPITYNFHHHPLIPIHKKFESFYCDACKRYDWGFSYECTTCTFRMHPDCADNFFKIQFNINREMEGYVLVEETSLGTDISSMYCRLCNFRVYTPYYRRDEDKYLHIACAHLPTEMEHELHPGCTLRPCKYGGETSCNLCCSSRAKYGCDTLFFKCDCGEFVVDARCAVKLFPITYKFHHHPLIPNHNLYESFYCVACKRDDSGFSYECTTCTFRVHQDCVSARMVKLPSHHHNLKLIYSIPGNSSGEPICCQICGEDMKDANYAFHCARCRYFFHIYSCRSIEHPSHPYPLILIEEGDNAVSASKNCHGCQLMTSVMYYTCSRKYYFSFEGQRNSFYLHKFCAELPQTIEHHLHPEHALIADYVSAEFMCNACHRPWESFSYYCAHQSCRFTIDIACAMKTLYLKREFHEHKLLSTHRSPSYPCRACNRRSKGPTFECTTCRFCIHQQCASAPMLKKYDLHPHKLKLTYLLQSSVKDGRKEVYCRICRESIELHNWAYHCAGCRYYTHVHKCSDPREIEGFDYEAALADAIRLPVADEFVSFATLFLMDTTISKEENEPNCWLPHVLKKLFKDKAGKKSRRMLFIEEIIETTVPHVCAQLLAAPCNNCALCEYVLPRSPSELWGPSSSLLKGYYFLRDTTEHCNGFDMCSFGNISNMKINSTVLPRYVKHEGHSHVLSTTVVDFDTWCDACENKFNGYGFRCNICQFTIDTYCALLPGSISHSYDKEHGFKLTYYSIEGVEEYVCEICEGDITTMWFYHCVKCDHSIHARCIWKHHVKFGPFVKFDNHKHELTVVSLNKTTSFKCQVCHQNETSGCRYCLYCEDCTFAAHLECIPDHIDREMIY